jgi:hypothetical protein
MIGPDAEEVAAEVFRLARVDPDETPGPLHLARRVFGPDNVRWAEGLWRDAKLAFSGGVPMLLVARRLPPRRVGFAVAHELAEHVMARAEYMGDDVERIANAAAAAVVAPRKMFRRRYVAVGPAVSTLADAFATSETLAALRIGEVTDVPTALVDASSVRVRGEEYGWPPDDELRSRLRAKALPKQLTEVPMPGGRRRTLLLAG